MSSDSPNSLFRLLCAKSQLYSAWRIVKAKKSHGGIDGLGVADFERNADKNIAALHQELLAGQWKPFPYLRSQLPKKEKKEVRNIGLLSVKDKVVQVAIKQLIEPKLEKLFLNNSYGYRVGKGHTKAVRRVQFECQHRTSEVLLRLDIDDFFDNVDHAILFDTLSKVITDNEICRLIQLCVEMGTVNRGGKWRQHNKGIPQGAVLSPLLANLYLHSFDQFVTSINPHYVRYADDFVIICTSIQQAENILNSASAYLIDQLNLTLNPPQIVALNDGFDFLGIHFSPEGLSLSDTKRQNLINNISGVKFSCGVFSEAEKRMWAGFQNYYQPLLPDQTLQQLDQALIDRLKVQVASQAASLPNKALLGTHLHAIGFLSEAVRQDKRTAISSILAAYSAAKEKLSEEKKLSKSQPENNNNSSPTNAHAKQNKRIIASRKTEYRKIEGQGAEMLIVSPYSVVGVSGGNVVVRNQGKVVSKRPSSSLRHVTIMGKGVSLSSTLVQYCSERKIPIDFFEGTKHYASLVSHSSTDNLLWQQQASLSPELRCRLGARILEGKLKNQRNLIKYFHKYHKSNNTALLLASQLSLGKLQSLISELKVVKPDDQGQYRESLMAIEAQAAVAYWEYIRKLLSDDDVDFDQRRHQGATDLVNSMLNYAYAILYNRLWQALLRVGLNPHDSVIHVRQRGKPTLVYYIVELFRQQGADRVVVSLIQKGQSMKMKGPLLSDESKKILSAAVLERLNRYEKYRGAEMRFEDIMYEQVKDIAAFITSNETFKPYIAKW